MGLTKINDARMYKPRVARSEMTMFRKMEFVNRSLKVSGPLECTIFSTPLKARKNAATCVQEKRYEYLQTKYERDTDRHVHSDGCETQECDRVEPFCTLRSVSQR